MGEMISFKDGGCGVQETNTQTVNPTSFGLPELLQQAALSVPEIDPRMYKEFCARMEKLALRIPKIELQSSHLEILEEVREEFERYHCSSMNAIEKRRANWRKLVARLLDELLFSMHIDPGVENAADLRMRVGSLLTGEEIHAFVNLLEDFLRLNKAQAPAGALSAPRIAKPFSANDNAAGLRDGEAAVTHLRSILEEKGCGYVVHFELCCLGSINNRFGVEAVHDCMMAVSAFLTRSLRSDDAVYYWSANSLLAVMRSPADLRTINSVIQRIADNNRDITLQIEGRTTMLRIPLDFAITPITNLKAAEDIYELHKRA